MTTQGGFSVTIDAAPETVWPWIAELDRHAEWSPKPYQVELVSGEANKVGSRYRSVGWIPGDKSHGNDVEITEVVPHERFTLRSTDVQGDFTSSYVLRPAGAGTEVTFLLVFPRMKGVTALLAPVLFPLVGQADIRKRGRLLKQAVEAH